MTFSARRRGRKGRAKMDRDQQFYTDEEVESRDTGVSAEEQDPMEAQEG